MIGIVFGLAFGLASIVFLAVAGVLANKNNRR